MPDGLAEALQDRYAIQRELGRGGMATVFLADDLRHHRQVAIKVLAPELVAVLGPERFLREIEITARLTHPHILPVHDSGRAGGTFFYVMPFVAGESLKERLHREKQLPVEDALQITREVADALREAHRNGIVHRDIKPANILLEAGHAVVSDFGIAKALTDAGSERLTATGIAVGTPGYMSPEQATGQSDVDERSDLYSLGCVLYEMLAGEAPFTGPSAQAVIAKQLSAPVPQVVIVRDTVTTALDDMIHRCLAKVPADRFQTAAEFMAALDAARTAPAGGIRPRPDRHARRRRILMGSTLALASALAVLGLGKQWVWSGRVDADTTRYAVLPFDHLEPMPALREMQRLHDALGRWQGLTIALASADRTTGRLIRGSVAPVDGAIRVHAALYDAGNERPLADHAVRIPADLRGADSLFSELADHLLLRGQVADERGEPWGTRSLPALQAFAHGMTALGRWDLGAAEAAFVAAAAWDPGYARAQLWTALVRVWSGAERARWAVAAEQAAVGTSQLLPRDHALSVAVLAQAQDDYGAACPLWRQATASEPDDFAGWYGLARCLVSDNLVIPDRRSPSGWSYRTSYHRALEAFRRAFELRPTILLSFRSRSFESLRNFFMTGNEMRGGFTAPPGQRWFVAEPSWAGDSLALIPYPADAEQPRPSPGTIVEAIRRQRERFRDVAVTWATAQPSSGAAMEAVAIGLGLLGDPAALDSLARARRLPAEPIERFRVAAAEVWLRLAFALPWDTAGVAQARALADSLVGQRLADAEPDPTLLPGLAALLGHARQAAAFSRAAAAADAMRVPPALRQTAPALLVYAALGGPRDSVVQLMERLRTTIDESLLPAEREIAHLRWVVRPATLAFPQLSLLGLEALEGKGDYLFDMQLAWLRGDTGTVRRGFARLRRDREGLAPATLTLDALYPEAALLMALGDVEAAARWVDPTLRALRQVAPHVLASPAGAASLVRMLALRATIAERLGDRDGAARWAGAVIALWSDADPVLKPLVDELGRFTR